MKNCFRIVICVGVLFALSSSCFSQNNFSSEDDLKKEASKLFEEDDFAGAFNLYSQLLSNYPKDPIYNYKFGVCMLMAGDNKETALTYLQYASQKQGVDKEATFYLGKAYHINYRFDEAIKEYTTYKSVASKAKLEKLQVDRQIEMCKNGKQLLSNLSDLYILDKKELNQSEYFRSYDLTDIGGKLLVKLEEFQTELDKKKKDNSIMYLAPKNNQIVFSSYGADGKNGRDIFLVRKQPNGEWSQPINIGPSINTKFDEDFPFLHPNGQVLYFCSKGHNSMGGYDVFKSTFNTSTNTWEPPVNVDFPINTPDDDVLYVTDAEEKTAFFSSARSSSNGKITVYKIGLEAKPIDALIVNGTISKDGKAVSNAKVTVKNVDNGELVGVYTVAPDGSYTLQVPNGGKLLVSVDMGEGKSYSELMVMPNLKEFKPLQQEIAFDATADKIQVKNKFDQAPSESNYMLALNFIKDKAKMDVNTNEAVYSSVQTTAPVVQASVDTLAKSTASVVDSVPATTKPTISNKDIVKIAYEDAKEALEEAKTLKQEADNATTFASQKNELVSLKQRELDNAKNELSSNQDEAKALTLNQKINELTVELDKLSKEAVVANNIAKKARGAATNKQAEADLSLEYAKELEQSIKGGGNANAAQAKLDAQKQKNEELAKSENTSENDGVASIKLDAENKQKEVDAAIKRKETIQKELVDMDKEIENLKTDAKKTKDDQLKQAINDQITDLEIDKDQKKQELTESDAKIKKLKDEALALSKEAELVSSLPVENKTNTSVVTTPTVAAIETSTTLAVKNNEPTVVTTNVAVIDTSKSQVNLAAQTIQTPSLVVTNSASVSPSVAVTPSNAVDTASKAIVVEKSTNSTEVGSASQNAELLQKQRVDSIEKIFVVEQEKYKKSLDASQNSTLEGKENQKTIYTQWVADLEKQLLFTKDEVAKTTDVEYKKVLEEKIQSIDKQLQEKKQLVATTTEEIQQIKQRETVAVVQETVVPVTTTPTTSVETIKLDSTIKSAAIEAPSVIATTIAASTSANSINTETTTVAITNTVAVSATTNTVSESAVAVNSPVVSTTTVSPVTTATVAEVPPVKMTKEEAQNQSKQFAQESAKLQQKANAARAKANAETDPAKRDSLFEVVIAIEKQAKQKQDESAKSVAQENKIEFDKNRIYLDQYVQLAANNSSTEASMASMFADEALIYFSEAEKERKQAAISTNYSTRNGALQKAAENERIAIEKQNKALESYKLLYSDFKPTETPQKVLAAPVVTPSVAAVTTPSTSVASSSAVEAKADSVPTKEVTTSIQASNTNTEVVVEQVKKDTALAVSTPTVAISTQPIQTLTTTSAAVAVVETPSVAAVKQEALASEVSAEMAVDSISQLPKLTSEQITQVKETREFKNFVILSNETEIAMREANAENKKAETLRFKAEEQSAWYYEYKAKATSATGSEKKEFEAKRDSAEALLAKYTQEADSVFKLAKNSEASANAKKVETELFLQSINSGNQVNVLAAANKSGVNVKPYLSKLPAVTTTSSSAVATATTSASTQQVDNKQEGITVAQTQTNPNQTTPKVLVPVKKTEVFERKTTPVYSKSKPIPINEKLPDGLLFKVQIGAFKNPIPQNLFKGITPITGETTPQGYIRYTAGIFTLFESANKTKDIIKSYGYKDAFVVAFLNGQRIPLSQALSMIGGSTATTINSSVAGNTPIQQVVNTVTPSSSTSTQNVEVSNIKDVKGLMYTVQVGVYSRQVSLDKLYGLSPVYTENMTNGLFRYTSGIYNRSKLANDAKSKIVNMGIKDAFVVAFLNSKRISLPEAQKLEQTEGDKVFATSTNMNQMPAAATNTSSSQNTVTQSNTTQPVNASTLPSGIQDLDDTKQKVYAIQIGAFKNEVPIEMANSFIKLASRKGNIKNFVDENGMTVYSIGGFTDYDQAAKFKQEIVTQEGIKDAFLIATQNGKKVPVK